ncbi:tetratricopeptide repeat protein [candidate division WOR-3 bacterium]|nr:tetratricopeptide repeat protein [candidate division WOR-3 bacterium]
MADELRVDSGALIFATLADVYISSGMIDEAISILNDGLARNPNYHLAKIMLGRAYYLKGECDKAIEILEPIYDVVKEDETANLCLSICYHKQGDHAQAMRFCEAVLRINPDNSEALKLLKEMTPERSPEPQVEVTAPEAPAPAAVVVEQPTIAVPLEAVVPAEPLPAGLQETVVETEAPVHEISELDIREIPEKTPEVESMPLAALDRPARRLLDLDSVKRVFISTKDGLLIKNYSKGDNDVEAMCASVAAICLDVDESFRMLKRGGLTRCIIEKPDETICVMAVGDSLLTVTTRIEAKPGLVFVYAHKIIEEIEEILR